MFFVCECLGGGVGAVVGWCSGEVSGFAAGAEVCGDGRG
jgi:hypothetical protein